MNSNPLSKDARLDDDPIPVYKKLEQSLLSDRQKLRIFNEQQEDLFPPLATPTIYGFSSTELDKANKDLEAVKVGDTHRADYTVRLNQWQKEYGEIVEVGHTDAFFDLQGKDGAVERIYFRDYMVHRILKEHFEQVRLLDISFNVPDNFKSVSQEFFTPINNAKPVSQELLDSANKIIQEDYKNGTGLYRTYEQPPLSARNRQNVSYIKEKPDNFHPYEYQQKASLELVDKFLDKNLRNLSEDSDENEVRKVILDAPTRSGKSYMVCWALKALIQKINETYTESKGVFSKQGSQDNEDSTFTIITSGFPDVFDEFQRTIEKHEHFREFFCWITKDQLLLNPKLIEEKQAAGYKHVVLSLSLQDLAGRSKDKAGSKDLKEIHKRIKGKVDFVIGDECHFAMFSEAKAYKAALEEAGGEVVLDEEEEKDIENEFDDGHKAKFTLSPRYGYIFASATTYSVLDRNVFDRDRDIVFISPYDIQAETDKINEQYQDNPLESPFFGRPKKHSFGIDLGCPASQLFKADKSGEFIHKEAARAVVESFYGIGRYENLPELFSNDVLKAAGAGRHMLWQMPSKNACDALEKLLRGLGISDDYHLLNISSKKRNVWNGVSVYKIKDEIHRRRFEKTITITVARFVTGVSIAEWDSVILANSGQSLTRRIQTYGRVETPWVESIDNGDEEQTKYCQKPNCFVFDLNPEQLYEFYNQVELHHSHLGNGNSARGEVMPGGSSFVFDGLQMKTITRQDVHEQLDEYIRRKKIGELAARIDPIGEMEISEVLREIIQITGNGKKVKVQLNELDDELTDREFPDPDRSEEDIAEAPGEKEPEEDQGKSEAAEEPSEKELQKLKNDDKKRREFIYKRLMLASLLTEETNVKQLLKLLKSDEEYLRLANHIGLSQSMLFALTEACDNFNVADRLERSTKALLARVKEKDVSENAEIAEADTFISTISELETLSDNQVLTSPETAERMIDALDLNFEKVADLLGNQNPDFIDTGAKSGVLLLTVYRRICQIIENELEAKNISETRAEEMKEEIGKHLVAVPTSSITYEILKKLYALMDWDASNIWWCEEAPNELKENWAYFIAKNTEDLQEIGGLPEQKQAAAMRKWAKQNKFSATLKEKKNRDLFLSFLIKIAKTMSEKFDYTISNPPYQDSGSGNKNKAKAIFHEFIDSGRMISNTSIMIHPARFLSGAGEVPSKWVETIISSPEFKVLEHYHDSQKIFPSADIKGGVAITSYTAGATDGGYPFGYIAHEELSQIVEKVQTDQAFKSLDDHIGSPFYYDNNVKVKGTEYRITTNWLTEYPRLFSKKKQGADDLLAYGRSNGQRVEKIIARKNVREDKRIDAYKVFVPKSNGTGAIGEILSTPVIGTPVMICTQTFITIGCFQDKSESEALLKYIKSKFARGLLGALKVTQHNNKGTWKYVPWQDFTQNSDIDWSKSIEEIDQQLYKKYGLSEEEIEFIETNVKEMK